MTDRGSYGYPTGPLAGPPQSRPVAGPTVASPPAPRRRKWPVRLAIILTIPIALLVMAYMMFALGPGTALVAMITAAVPFLLVFAVLRWVDRWEPEPRGAVLFAFLWGGAVSVFIALFVDTGVQLVTAITGTEIEGRGILMPVIQAPFVEEIAKAFGLVILLLFGRRYLSGPVDGFFYAGVIGAGFAFTENIQYFGLSLQQAGIDGTSSAFWGTVFARGVMSPFAHVLFSAFTGLALGLAQTRRNVVLTIGGGLGGLALAILGHALWNGSSIVTSFSDNPNAFVLFYLLVHVPIFLTLAALVLWLRRRERKMLATRLSEYGRSGWFTPEEVSMLTSQQRRRRARAWAERFGPVGKHAMTAFQESSVELAVHRNTVLQGRVRGDAAAEQDALLRRVTDARRRLTAVSRPVVAV